MVDKNILGLPLIGTGAALADGDVAHIVDASDNKDKRASMLAISEYTLKSKTIPATGTAIVTDTATQTMTNKTLTSPKINSATTITANGADINKLSGMTSSTAELNKLTGVTVTPTEINRLIGVTSNIQTQINAISAGTLSPLVRTFTHMTGLITATQMQIITQSEIKATTGETSYSYYVNPYSLTIAIWELSSSSWTLIAPAPGVGESIITTTTAHGTVVLNQVAIKLDNAKSYRIVLTFKLLELSGV